MLNTYVKLRYFEDAIGHKFLKWETFKLGNRLIKFVQREPTDGKYMEVEVYTLNRKLDKKIVFAKRINTKNELLQAILNYTHLYCSKPML